MTTKLYKIFINMRMNVWIMKLPSIGDAPYLRDVSRNIVVDGMDIKVGHKEL
jgi:hypothetical protein